MILPYLDNVPSLDGTPDLAPGASIIGRVRAGAGLVLRGLATLRGDGESITVGRDVFFGERATVHIHDSVEGSVVGDHATIGRYAIVHACTLGDGVVLGEGAIVMDDAQVGPYAVIGAGTLISPRKRLEGGYLYAGNPAIAVRPVTREEAMAWGASLRAGTPADPVRDDSMPVAAVPPAEPAADVREAEVYVAPTATLAGAIELAYDSGVYFGCRLDAGGARIRIGNASNVQDNTLLVTDRTRGDIIVGDRVTFGHNVRMGAATLHDDTLIGMGCEVGDGVVVERGACIGARALVKPGTVVKAGWIWAGRPARAFREVKEAEREEFARGVAVYVRYGKGYRSQAGSPAPDLTPRPA